MPENDELKKYLDYDGLEYLLQRFPKTTVHCTFDDEFAGETATLTHGTTTYTKTVPATSPFELTFAVNELGTWTLNCSYLGTQYSDTVDITYLGQKGEITLSIVPDGTTATPINDIHTWLKCANLNKSYTTLAEVLADTETYETLLADSNACQYMKRSTEFADSGTLIPAMTDNTHPSGTVSASSTHSSVQAYYAFDKNDSTDWTTQGSQSTSYIRYVFPSQKTVRSVKVKFRIQADHGYTMPSVTFKVQGSTDGETFGIELGEFSTSSLTGTAYAYSELLETKYVSFNATNIIGIQLYANGDIFPTGNTLVRVAEFKVCSDASIIDNQDAMSRLGKFDYACNLLLADSTWAEAIGNSDYMESVLNVKVPTMTSNITPEGSVYASTRYGSDGTFYEWKAFSPTETNGWVPNASENSGHPYIQYTFTKPVCITHVSTKGITNSASDVIYHAIIKASNDDFVNDTHDLGTVDIYFGNVITATSFANADSYETYRIYYDTRSSQAWTAGSGVKLQFYGRERSTQYEGKVPQMTGYTTPEGTVADSQHHSSGPGWCVFDNADSSYYLAPSRGTNNEWVSYQFTSPKNIKRVYLRNQLGADNETGCGDYYIQAYVEGNWVTLYHYSPNSSNFTVYLTFTNPYTVDTYRVLMASPLISNRIIHLNNVQFYEEAPGNTVIHSAVNDTVYTMEDGEPVVLCTTNEKGIGKCDLSGFQAGPITLYSSVAKNPDDLSADYSKTITITKTQYGGTTEAYVMPNTVKTLYWYGYMSSICEAATNANGWTPAASYPTTVNPTFNTNNVQMTSTNSNATGLGTNVAISFTHLKMIVSMSLGSSAYQPLIAAMPNKSDSYMSIGTIDTNWTAGSSIEYQDRTYDVSSKYLCINTHTRTVNTINLYALWYE